MRFRGIVTGIAVLICVTACTSGSDPDPSPPRPKVIAPADALTMKEGRDFEVVAMLPKKVGGQLAYYQGVSSDGMVFGSTAEEDPNAEQPLGGGSTLITTRDDVFLLDPKSGKVTPISDGASRAEPVGVAGIDVNDEWVVWTEIQEAFGAKWTLHSYDRSSGEQRILGSQRDAIEGDTGLGSVQINGNKVLVSTFAFGDEDAKVSMAKKNQILSAPLDGSTPLTELMNGVTGLEIADDGMTFIDVATDALTFRDTTSGETRVVNVGTEDVEDYWECQDFQARVLMTCVGSENETTVRLKPNNGAETSFGPFTNDFGYPDLDTGWATIVIDPDGDAKIYAIDTKRMKLYKVADTQGGWTLMGHNFALVQPFNGAKGDIKLIKLR